MRLKCRQTKLIESRSRLVGEGKKKEERKSRRKRMTRGFFSGLEKQTVGQAGRKAGGGKKARGWTARAGRAGRDLNWGKPQRQADDARGEWTAWLTGAWEQNKENRLSVLVTTMYNTVPGAGGVVAGATSGCGREYWYTTT